MAPIIAGIDKFLHLLTDWDKYLAPIVPNTLHIQPHTFMVLVGVAAWLAGIILNLVTVGGFLDVALRDLGLLLGAVSLARLAEAEVRVGVPAHA